MFIPYIYIYIYTYSTGRKQSLVQQLYQQFYRGLSILNNIVMQL